MTKEELKKINKAVLIGICKDLSLGVLAEDNKASLSEKISACGDWKTHSMFNVDTDVPEVKNEGDLTEEEIADKKRDDLLEQCEFESIEITGEEDIDELEALLKKCYDDKVKQAELESARTVARAIGVAFADTDNADDILTFVTEFHAREAHMKEVRESDLAAAKAHLEKGVTFDYLQQVNSHLIDATNQMIRQMEREKKSSDRFHAAVKTLITLRNQTFIR